MSRDPDWIVVSTNCLLTVRSCACLHTELSPMLTSCVPYPSALEVRSRRGAIQIHVTCRVIAVYIPYAWVCIMTEREEEERLAREKREREEAEYKEKARKLAEIEEKKRQREQEIEEKMRHKEEHRKDKTR